MANGNYGNVIRNLLIKYRKTFENEPVYNGIISLRINIMVHADKIPYTVRLNNISNI